MNTNKILVGGVVGGIVFFFLGWLIWGFILASYMIENTNQIMMRPMVQMIWWSLIVSNLGWGFVLSVVYAWSGITGWKAGAARGALLGFLISLSIDLGQYAMNGVFNNFEAVIVDIVATVVMVVIGGGIIGWAMGMVKKAS